MFALSAFFQRCVLPEGLAKLLPPILQIPKCLDLMACTIVSSISMCKFGSTITSPPVLKGPEAGKWGLDAAQFSRSPVSQNLCILTICWLNTHFCSANPVAYAAATEPTSTLHLAHGHQYPKLFHQVWCKQRQTCPRQSWDFEIWIISFHTAPTCKN